MRAVVFAEHYAHALPHFVGLVVESVGATVARAIDSAIDCGSLQGLSWNPGNHGDWDYALFGPDGKRRDQLNQAPCLACHKPQETNSFVFTLDKLRKATG